MKTSQRLDEKVIIETSQFLKIIRCINNCRRHLDICPLEIEVECRAVSLCLNSRVECRAVDECNYLKRALKKISSCGQYEQYERSVDNESSPF